MKFFRCIVPILLFLYFGCSGSERYTVKNKVSEPVRSVNNVRLLIDEGINTKQINIDSNCFLLADDEQEISINSGTSLYFSVVNGNLSLRINNDLYEGDYFELIPTTPADNLICDNIKLRGRLKIVNNLSNIWIVNSIDIESYLKGVIPREMPLGRNEENYEALKAFAICARTYSLMKIKPENYFDLYTDVRDQVYGGTDAEKSVSNRAVDETKDLILIYDGKPAMVYYHSTCGGKTEDVKNVFGKDFGYYLTGVEDGSPAYCSISPSFEWEEIYTSPVFINRLRNSGLIDSRWDLIKNLSILNRFKSGRVSELQVELLSSQTREEKSVILKGNSIRSILRTSDNKSILKSNWFDILFDEDKNVIIKGRGYGHGVGLCQWGSVALSRMGKTYREILEHYFPGIKITSLN